LKTLEPCEGKLSSTVPRGERRSNLPDLPDKEEEKDMRILQKFRHTAELKLKWNYLLKDKK